MADDVNEMDAELEPAFVELDKTHTLLVAGPQPTGDSKQPGDADGAATPDDAIEPPIALESWARLSRTNGMRRAIIDAIARNTVGLGYTILLAETADQQEKDENRIRAARQALEACSARDRRLDSPSLTELLMAVKTDEEEVGNGYIEVSRNRLTGLVDGLFHAPGKLVRRRKDRKGFLMLRGEGLIDKPIQFVPFGDKIKYDDNGQPTNALAAGASWSVNELLPFRIYSSESRDYGMPRDAALALDYAGDKLAAESNISFFDSSGTPPTVIFVQGEETNQGGRVTFKVPQATVDRIAGTLKSDSGHRHRVGIIPLPPGSSVKDVQLGQISERDMGFTGYRKDNVGRQLAAFRLSPIFVSADDSGRYTAEVQRAISLEQVFDPEQSRYETRLHNTLMKDLGFPELAIGFKRLAVEADAAKRDSADKMAESQTITRREHRKAHGYGPLPEADTDDPVEAAKEQKVVKGWNDEIVNSKEPLPAAPPGAENRVTEGTGQQGLTPGVGQREQRSSDQELADRKKDVRGNGRRVPA
jgi:capsid portal protein